MNNLEKKVALLVHCSDRYEILFPGFHYFFSKHWDFNIPCTCYFATEEKTLNFEGFVNVQSGKGEWSDRLKRLLKEKISEEYILYLQEDMWISKQVNPLFFKELFTMAAAKKWKQVKLHSCGVYKTIATQDYIEGFNIGILNNNKSTFLMSHQVTLWEKQYLLDQLPGNESPWLNEMNGTQRLKNLNPEIIHIDYFAENGGGEINENNNPVGRSCYYAISLNSRLYHTVRPYLQLLKKDPVQNAYAKELGRRYIWQITHDGKPGPRKETALMDFRLWLKGLVPRLGYALSGK